MSLFNAIYTLGGCRRVQPIQNNSIVNVEFDSQGACAKTARWAKWLVSLPVRFAHGVYNHASMIVHKDINEVVARQIYKGNSINYMPFLAGKSGHIFSSSKAIAAITSEYRHHDHGPFERERGDLFIPMLKDLFPEEKEIGPEDFLFTCSDNHVKSFRDPILNYVGPKELPALRPQIAQVAEDVLDSLDLGEGLATISARKLADTYTVAVLARLFLNHPGTLEDYQNIGKAASYVWEYQFLKKWGKPTEEQTAQYERDLQILRAAIEKSSGDFVDSLKSSDLSPIGIKGELMLVYSAGSETTSSTMHYVLWRLGQDVDLQEKIRNNPEENLDKFIQDCLQSFTPAAFFSRWASRDLIIKVQNRNGITWQYPIAKGEALIVAPKLAGSFTFGGGLHSCPGQWLARAEIGSMVLKLLNRFAIDSFPRKKKLATIPGYGFLKVEPVELAFRKIG